MSLAFVFPGQGSQAVGMARELAEAFAPARLVFEEIDDALDQRLSRLIFEGPEDDLTLTENAQPALMAVSLAVVRVLESEGGLVLADKARLVAGHSLGEYSALAAAGGLELADAARLLKRRGQSMQEAVPVGEGAMAAVLGLDLDAVGALATAAAPDPEGGTEVCEAANDNAPGQVVISGHAGAIERAIELAPEHGAKRCIPLPVSAPFHCALMAPAAEAMAEALALIALRPTDLPLVANVTAEAVSEPERIRRLLVEQVTATVRWRESVLAMKALGIERIVELGPGKVLGGLVKRIDRELTGSSVGTPADVEDLLKSL